MPHATYRLIPISFTSSQPLLSDRRTALLAEVVRAAAGAPAIYWTPVHGDYCSIQGWCGMFVVVCPR